MRLFKISIYNSSKKWNRYMMLATSEEQAKERFCSRYRIVLKDEDKIESYDVEEIIKI